MTSEMPTTEPITREALIAFVKEQRYKANLDSSVWVTDLICGVLGALMSRFNITEADLQQSEGRSESGEPRA